MTKQEWLDIKKGGHLSFDTFYQFYLSKNKKETTMSPQEFQINFQEYINGLGTIPTAKMIQHFDNEFAITKLTDKHNQLIKEY